MAQPYVGEVRMFAGNFAPAGWAFCNGALLPISENETLFNLIGTTFGGDGESTFALPNLCGRVPLHMGTGPGGTTYQLGEASGVEQVTIDQNSTPRHNHGYLVSTAAGLQASPQDCVLGENASIFTYLVDTPNTPMFNQALTPIGGSQPHENMQPFLVVSYIISLFGIFPSQT